MARKKTRKSRRARRRGESAPRPRTAPQAEPEAVADTPSQAASAPSISAGSARSRGLRRSTADFVSEYSYVYFDLRKMFTIALIMFILLILTNLVLTRMITL